MARHVSIWLPVTLYVKNICRGQCRRLKAGRGAPPTPPRQPPAPPPATEALRGRRESQTRAWGTEGTRVGAEPAGERSAPSRSTLQTLWAQLGANARPGKCGDSTVSSDSAAPPSWGEVGGDLDLTPSDIPVPTYWGTDDI